MVENTEHVTQWFREVATRLLMLRWWIISILIVVDAVAVLGITQIQIDVSDESWFLEDDPLTLAIEEFERIFGNEEYVALLIEADDVFAPEILTVIRELGGELLERVPFADDIASLTNLEFTRGTEDGVEIGDIVPEEIPTEPEAIEAIRAQAFSKPFLINRMFSDDCTQAWIVLHLQPYPDDWEASLQEYPNMLVGRTVLEILHQEKYQPYTIKASGSPVLGYEEREFFSHEANRTMMLALGIAIVVLFLFLRSLNGIIIPLVTAISAIAWVFGAMGYAGIKVDNMVVTIPIYLGMAISIGYSFHLFNFFRQAFSTTRHRREAIIYAVGETGWPIFFTAATTISALLSFYFVPIRQVRWMGLSSAAVVLTTYLIVMSFTPVFLSFGAPHTSRFNPRTRFDGWVERGFRHLHRLIQTYRRGILLACIGLVICFLGGLTRISVSMNLQKNLGLKIPYIQRVDDIAHTKIGTMDSFDVTLQFEEPGRVKHPEVLEKFERLIAEVQTFPFVSRVSSLLDVIKDMNQVMHEDDPAFYRIPDEQELIAQLLLLYEMSNGTEQENWVDYEYTTLRLLVEVNDIDTATLKQNFERLQEYARALFPEAQIGLVGGLVQISVVQDYIARGEVVSFLIALVVIGILMMLVFRSVKTGGIGMIPNIAPVLVVGGLMGYLDIPLEMTTMMIIPMLLGLAVDDTIHFITHCQLEYRRTGDYQDSIGCTFQTVGKSIFMTSFILMATFSVYVTSIAKFFVNIGLLAMAGILSALLADYTITPILIAWSQPFRNIKVLSNVRNRPLH